MNDKQRNKKLFQILAIVKSMLPEDQQEPEPETVHELPSGATVLGDIGDIVFDDLFIVNNDLYKKTKGGSYRKLKFTVKNNERIYRLIYKDGEKNKSIQFNLTRWLNEHKDTDTDIPKNEEKKKKKEKKSNKNKIEESPDEEVI